MTKVIIQQDVPPMPGAEEDLKGTAQMSGGASSPSTGSEKADEAVSEELAGDLIALPFEAWHSLNDAADPLTETEKASLAGPFSRILEKYGLGKIAKDEIVFGFYLTAICYGRIKAVRDANKDRKAIEEGQKV